MPRLKPEDLKRVSESDVPATKIKTNWEEIFKVIASGEAFVFEHKQAAPSTIRSALKKFQKQGKFTYLRMRSRKLGVNQYRTWVVNPSKKTGQ